MQTHGPTLRERIKQRKEEWEAFAEEARENPDEFDHPPEYYERHAEQYRRVLDDE